MPTLSPATVTDLDDLLRLEQAGFDHAAWSREAWAAEVTGADRHVVVAREGARVLGVATFQQVPGDEVCDLHRVVVDPARRGQRLGEALLAVGEEWARAAGAQRMLLEVDQTNDSALALYRRRGFVEIFRRQNYYGPGAHAFVMAKELNQ